MSCWLPIIQAGPGRLGGGGAGATPYTLTSITDIPSGAVDGDAGELDGRIYVLANLTVAAGAGGGTLLAWVPPEVAGAAAPEVIGWFDGDEDAATLAAQGNTVTGTATTTGTEIELAASGTSSFQLLTQSTTVATADRFYMRGLYRADTSGADAQAIIHRIGDSGASDYIAVGQAAGGSATLGFLTPLNAAISIVQRTPLAALPSTTSTAALIETVHHGMDISSEIWRDGNLQAVYRGNLQTSGSDFVSGPFARSNAGGNSCTLRASYQVVIKW